MLDIGLSIVILLFSFLISLRGVFRPRGNLIFCFYLFTLLIGVRGKCVPSKLKTLKQVQGDREGKQVQGNKKEKSILP